MKRAKKSSTAQAVGRSGRTDCSAPEYAYATLEEYESIVGFKVNDAFRTGWQMARTTMPMLRGLCSRSGGRMEEPNHTADRRATAQEGTHE